MTSPHPTDPNEAGDHRKRPRSRKNSLNGTPLGSDIKQARLAAGLTQAQLASRVGISVPFIQKVEAGATNFRPETLLALLWYLGYDLRALPSKLELVDES